MEYLKSFESHSDPLYSEIFAYSSPGREDIEDYYGKYINFGKSDIEQIKLLFDDIGIPFELIKHKDGWESIEYRYNSTRLEIVKLPDDWYLAYLSINSHSKYHKCDQIDGLTQYLKDIHNQINPKSV